MDKYYSTRNMKKLFISLSLIALSAMSVAQVAGGQLEKLMDLYVVGDYEKCLTKAEKYMEDDEYKSLSEPYLYAAMCWMKISQDPELMEYDFYKNAVKNAAKLGAKFVKKDNRLKTKGKNYLFDQNKESVYELMELACAEGKMHYAMNKWSKAAQFYKLAWQMDPTDDGVAIMYGLTLAQNRNSKEGLPKIEGGYANLKANAKNPDWKVNKYTEATFHDAMLYLTDYYVSIGEQQKAMECIQTARMLDPEYPKFKAKYKAVVG